MQSLLKRAISLGLSAVLVAGLVPAAAFAEGASELSTAANSISQSLVAKSDGALSSSGLSEAQGALPSSLEADATTVRASDAVSFIFLNSSIVSVGSEQLVAVGLEGSDDLASASLLVVGPDGQEEWYGATSLAGASAGFVLEFLDDEMVGTYVIYGMKYSVSSESEECCYVAFEQQTEEDYVFDVVSPELAEQLNAVSSDEEGVSAYVVGEDGNLNAAGSVEEALEIAGADAQTSGSSERSASESQSVSGKTYGLMSVEDGTLNSMSTSGDIEDSIGSVVTDTRENYLIVAIDPGHGGSDGGASGNGVTEKYVNLTISKALASELDSKYTGVSTYLTRTDDSYVGLQERVDLAVKHHADVFVCIHNNSSTSSDAHGSEVWAPTTGSSYNYDVAVEGNDLARKILDQLVALGLTERGVYQRLSTNGECYPDGNLSDYYTVIDASRYENMAGIIVEHAFVSNSSDASNYLSSNSALTSLGVADATGIAKYYNLGTDAAASAIAQVKVQAHVSYFGWEDEVYDGKVAGTTGHAAGLEGLKVSLVGSAGTSNQIKYRAAVDGSWQDWVGDGELAGTTGEAKNINAVQMQIEGDSASRYQVAYRVHVSDVGWTDWVSDGETAGPSSLKGTIEAVEVKVIYQGECVKGKGYVSGTGWMSNWVTDGKTIGAVGQGKALEAFRLELGNQQYEGSVVYQSCANDVWSSSEASDGEVSGVTGQSLPLEAVRINLTSEMAEHYDIYYRAYATNIGWMNWAKNGESAGTYGYGRSLQAIQVRLVEKGSTGPSGSGDAFKTTGEELEGMPRVYTNAHVQNVGWQGSTTSLNGWSKNGALSGTVGKGLRMESLKVSVRGVENLGVAYLAHVQNIGWQGDVNDVSTWDKNATTAGTTGQSLRVEALKMCLTGDAAENYDIYYRVHVQNYGWMAWAKNGESAGTTGMALRVEAIQVIVCEKGEEAPANDFGGYSQNCKKQFVTPSSPGDINYSAHVQNVGWQSYHCDGALAGTTGQSLQVEGLKINVADDVEGVGVSYQTHVQNIGWQSAVSDGKLAGTTGRSLRVEAIRISLTGDNADDYDVYYRVHIQNYGWLDWAKNGEDAGSSGLCLRVEAIKIVLVKKGEAAPGSTDRPYVDAEYVTSSKKYAIMGSSTVTASKLAAHYASKGYTYPSSVYSSKGASTIQEFCEILVAQAKSEGVRPEVLYAQAMHETGYLQFGGDVDAEQCNFGGLGATGNGVKGNVFSSVSEGLLAQTQHLKCYASTEPLNNDCVDQRWSDSLRGKAPYVEDLGGKWAADTGYGTRLRAIINELI